MPADPNIDTPPTQVPPSDAPFYCGYVAIMGRPNVGKSTLMNHLLGQKLSITSRKPQTTRHKIVGIHSTDTMQAIFLDTPGLHQREVKAMNTRMNMAAKSALTDVDVALFVVDGDKWTDDDAWALEHIKASATPAIAVINKIDVLAKKDALLPTIERLSQRHEFASIIPVSALKNDGLGELSALIQQHLPAQPPIYDVDMFTDRSERFLASEVVREKVMRTCGNEVPYDLTVQIDSFKDEPAHTDPETGKPRKACTFIDATIFVEREGQKKIIIGDKGARIKQVGIDARKDLEQLFDRKIMLTLWVKVKRGWSNDERVLASFGL